MVALLVDEVIAHLALPLAPACLVDRVAFAGTDNNYDNVVTAKLSKLIKNLASVAEMISAGTNSPASAAPKLHGGRMDRIAGRISRCWNGRVIFQNGR